MLLRGQLGLPRLGLGDVALDADVVAQRPVGVVDGRQAHLAPEGAAVLAHELELGADRALGGHGRPDPEERRLVGRGDDERPCHAAHGLLGDVARLGGEAGVDPLDPPAGRVDHDRVTGVLGHEREPSVLALDLGQLRERVLERGAALGQGGVGLRLPVPRPAHVHHEHPHEVGEDGHRRDLDAQALAQALRGRLGGEVRHDDEGVEPDLGERGQAVGRQEEARVERGAEGDHDRQKRGVLSVPRPGQHDHDAHGARVEQPLRDGAPAQAWQVHRKDGTLRDAASEARLGDLHAGDAHEDEGGAPPGEQKAVREPAKHDQGQAEPGAAREVAVVAPQALGGDLLLQRAPDRPQPASHDRPRLPGAGMPGKA